MWKSWQTPWSTTKDGVWTHRYTSGEVREALRKATEDDSAFFRSGGRLDPKTGDAAGPTGK
jgi:hypothetical protein